MHAGRCVRRARVLPIVYSFIILNLLVFLGLFLKVVRQPRLAPFARPLRIGIGGPVGSGKTALVDNLCKRMRERFDIAVVTNDIYTREDAEERYPRMADFRSAMESLRRGTTFTQGQRRRRRAEPFLRRSSA